RSRPRPACSTEEPGMFELEVTYRNGQPVDKLTCAANQCELGKARTCILRLRGWRVAPVHARIERSLARLFVEDLSRGYELEVNGKLVGRYGPLGENDVIGIGGYLVRVRPLQTESEELPPTETDLPYNEEEAAGVVSHDQAAYMEWSKYIHGELCRAMDLRRMDLESMAHDEVRAKLSELVDELMEQVRARLPKCIDCNVLRKIVLDEAVGLGPLEDLLADESITEIMVNRHDDIYVERSGRLERTSINFSSDATVMATIERIISPLGRRI